MVNAASTGGNGDVERVGPDAGAGRTSALLYGARPSPLVAPPTGRGPGAPAVADVVLGDDVAGGARPRPAVWAAQALLSTAPRARSAARCASHSLTVPSWPPLAT